MNPVLLVFDIDWTLVAFAGQEVYDVALARAAGISRATAGVYLGGKTDREILRELVSRHQPPDGPDTWVSELIPRYLAALRERVACEPPQVLPGVGQLLAALWADPEYRLCLGTGNLAEGARIKLEACGLQPYFPVGAYAEDGTDRAGLVATAVTRARAHYGQPLTGVIVIGDTPRDVQAGRANGYRTLAVATGVHTVHELLRSGAHAVLPDFADLQRSRRTIAELSQE